jgi:hypothetical protein
MQRHDIRVHGAPALMTKSLLQQMLEGLCKYIRKELDNESKYDETRQLSAVYKSTETSKELTMLWTFTTMIQNEQRCVYLKNSLNTLEAEQRIIMPVSDDTVGDAPSERGFTSTLENYFMRGVKFAEEQKQPRPLGVGSRLTQQIEQLKALGANPCCDCVRCRQVIRDCDCANCTKTAARAPASASPGE